MAYQKISINISLTYDQMIQLLLLSGRVEIVVEEHRLVINGCQSHRKHGEPGVDNADVHYLKCDVDIDNYSGQADIHVKSHDGRGTVYTGMAEIEYELGGMSE